VGEHPLRVVIAEDEPLIRTGLEIVLAGNDFHIVRAVATGEELISAVEADVPDLVITDILMPPTFTDEGLQAAIRIRAEHPGLAVCVLSQHILADPAQELLKAAPWSRRAGSSEATPGGIGYLLKQRVADIDAFLADVRRIVAGEVVLDPEVAEDLLDQARPHDNPVSRLTERQREVLALVAQGRTNAAIAEQLYVSEKAVNQHLSRIYETLGLTFADDDTHRRVQAVLHYLDNN
jgi:DNA-binding NarL/FixJ family response regulator